MRSAGNVTLNFGMLNIPINLPVKLYKATETHDARFNLFHVHDDGSASRIAMPTTCIECGAVVERKALVKGVERGDQVVLVSAEELADAEVDAGQDLELIDIKHRDEIDPARYETPYYLGLDPKAGKGVRDTYALIRAVLAETSKVGICRYTSGKTHLAALRADHGDVLVVQNMCWPDEHRGSDEISVPRGVEVNPRGVKLLIELLDQIGDPDPSAYTDTFAARIVELIEAKESGVSLPSREDAEAVAEVGDLIAALEESVKAKAAAKKRPAARKTA